MADTLSIEVAYALPQRQELVRLQLPEGSTVLQAIENSGITQKYPEIDLSKAKVGIYGKLTRFDTVLRDRDRIEIYRPLIADPKDVRRKRADEEKMATKKAAGEN